jgi:hypothetical protein
MMLIHKKFNKDDVVSFKLTNGDEIISRYVEDKGASYVFSNTMAITITPKGPGVVPWFILGENSSIEIDKSHILSIVHSKFNAAEQYLSHFQNPQPFLVETTDE